MLWIYGSLSAVNERFPGARDPRKIDGGGAPALAPKLKINHLHCEIVGPLLPTTDEDSSGTPTQDILDRP